MLSIASRKRAADILSKETEIETRVTPGSSDEEGDDHHAQSPPSKVRRIRRSCSPVVDSQNTGMVQSILDADIDSIDELDKEDQEYQEEVVEAEEEEEEAEKYMEEVEGEHNKFAGEEVSADCNLIQIPNRLLPPGGSERGALHYDQCSQIKGIKISYAL
jgi:hypothetical protein